MAFSSNKNGITGEFKIIFFNLENASNIFDVSNSLVKRILSPSILKFTSSDKNNEIIGSIILANI